MFANWCPVCCTPHDLDGSCPGELQSTGPERHGFRVNVETPQGIEAYGVLVAEAGGLWRARIMTFPNVLWLVPGGRATMKFAGRTAADAEQRAITYLRAHCVSREFRMRDTAERVASARLDRATATGSASSRNKPAQRKLRFLPVRFGVANPAEPGGTGNLSETGLFIITNTPLDKGRQVKLLLETRDRKLNMSGSVKWRCLEPHQGRSPGMGVQIENPSPEYVEYVRGLD